MVEGKNRNSFKELEQEELEKYSENVSNVKKSLDSNLGSISFITNVIDIYFSKVVSYVVNMSGGTESQKDTDLD